MTWEYLAGFFDGEGHTNARHRPNGTWSFIWQITQKNEEVLDEIASFLEAEGYHVLWQNNRVKHCAVISVHRVGDVERLLNQLRPLVIVKRDQIDATLNAIGNRPRKGGEAWAAARRKKTGAHLD